MFLDRLYESTVTEISTRNTSAPREGKGGGDREGGREREREEWDGKADRQMSASHAEGLLAVDDPDSSRCKFHFTKLVCG